MDLEIVGRRGNAIIVAVSFDMTKARPFGLAFLRWYQNFFRAFMARTSCTLLMADVLSTL